MEKGFCKLIGCVFLNISGCNDRKPQTDESIGACAFSVSDFAQSTLQHSFATSYGKKGKT
jgi:hypothetical protein